MRALSVVMACAALLASAALHAQARVPTTRGARSSEQQVEKPPVVLAEAERTTKVAQMEAWLDRLVGQFSGEAVVALYTSVDKMQSTATCSHFGSGPGVRCLIGEPVPVARPDAARTTQSPGPALGGYGGVLPLMYFGIDPNKLEIEVMIIDGRQLGARSGPLEGDTVDFTEDSWDVCHRDPLGDCWVKARITALPSGEITMSFARNSWALGRRTPSLTGGKATHSHEIEIRLRRATAVDSSVIDQPP